MAFHPEIENLSAFEAKDTSRKIPVGFSLLFWGLIAWGAYYLWAYTPAFGGWQQAQDVEGGGAPLSSNLLATIAFTAIPTAVALGLTLVQRRKRA
ncbi:MAG TPA: hypothetical protein VF912_18090 [Anaeromyxobacter sp.]